MMKNAAQRGSIVAGCFPRVARGVADAPTRLDLSRARLFCGARRALLFVWLFAAFGPGVATAQPARVELGVDPRDIFVDQPFSVDVAVDYAKESAEPKFPTIADCELRLVGTGPSSVMTTIVNGKYSERRSVRYRYQLTPKRVGKFEIPPFDVTIDGRTVQTQRLTFEARKPEAAESVLTARVTTDAQRLYVGQQARFQLDIFVKAPEVARAGTRGAAGRIRPDGQSTWSFVNTKSMGPFKTGPGLRTEQRTSADGSLYETWYVYSFADSLIVTEPGPLRFADLVVQMRYPLEYTVDSFGFMQQQQVSRDRSVSVVPDYGEIEVLPLPMSGRPADFSGAVGRFSITTSVTPAEARVGDPIELTVDLRGDGALDVLPPPKLDTNRELTSVFRLPDTALTGETIGTDAKTAIRRYRVTLRPSKPVDELPAISYSYFDPEMGQYATAVAPSKPLRVRAAERVDASEVVGLTAPAGETPKADVPPPLDGLQPNRTDEAALLSAPRPVGLIDTLLVALAPPALFSAGVVAAAIARARRDGPAQRRRNALTAAGERIRAAAARTPRELAAEVHAALGAYLSDRLDEPAGRYIGRAGVDLLTRRGVSDEIVNQWRRLIETAEAASFGGLAGAEAARLADDAHAALAAAQREGI